MGWRRRVNTVDPEESFLRKPVKNFLNNLFPYSLCEFPVTAETNHNKSGELKQEQHIILGF